MQYQHLLFSTGKVGSPFMMLGEEYNNIKEDLQTVIEKVRNVIASIKGSNRRHMPSAYALEENTRGGKEKLTMVRYYLHPK